LQPALQPQQMYLSAYAGRFTLEDGQTLPLVQQRASGGFALRESAAIIPVDGYYMLLWELGTEEAQEGTQLCLGINKAEAQLSLPRPGYDAAQQITWLNKDDKVRLFAKGGGTAKFSSAMLTIIRLG